MTAPSPAGAHLCRRADPVRFAHESLAFEPDPPQAAILRDVSRRIVICGSRQWGKSTTVAALAVHHMLHNARALCLVLSSSGRQSGEFVRKAKGFLRHLGHKVRGDGQNQSSILLPTGARMVGVPDMDGTIRGFSAVTMLVVDEAAQVEDSAYMAVRPMLGVSRGTLILLSTPFGKRGFFHDEWRDGGPRWSRHFVPATECPRLDPEFLEEERVTLGDLAYRQEYLCEFLDEAQVVFPRNVVDRAFTRKARPLWPKGRPD